MISKQLLFLTSVFSFRSYAFHVYEHTREKRLQNEKTDVKNKSCIEIIILRGVVLAFYRSEIFCEEKKLGFGLVVLKCPIFDERVPGFILKIDHRLFRPFGLFLPNKQL